MVKFEWLELLDIFGCLELLDNEMCLQHKFFEDTVGVLGGESNTPKKCSIFLKIQILRSSVSNNSGFGDVSQRHRANYWGTGKVVVQNYKAIQ